MPRKKKVSAALRVFSVSNETESPQFLEEWLSEEHLDAREEPEPGSPLEMAVAAGNRRIRRPHEYESPSSEAFLDTPSFDSISDIPDTLVVDDLESEQSLDQQQPGPIDEICSVSSDACSDPSVYSAGSSGFAGTQHRPNGARQSGDC